MEKAVIDLSVQVLRNLCPRHHRPQKFQSKKRERAYNELTVQFFGITRELSDEKKLELDGLLWDLALRLVETL